MRTSRADVRPHPPQGHARQLIRLALGSRRRGRARRARPGARPRRVDRGRSRRARRRQCQGQAEGRAGTRVQERTTLEVPADLGERIEHALRQTALDRLGMEARARQSDQRRRARSKPRPAPGKVHLLIHAADAREDGRKTLDQAWRVGGGEPRGVIFPEARTILSLALGRENVVHVALTDPAAASRVSHALARWRAFTDPRTGLDGGDPASGPGSADEFDEGIE